MAHIHFKWNAEKAIQATSYLVAKLGKVDKVKLAKLLYIADRDHFLRHGAPITGDDQWALPKGPAPTRTLDLLDGDLKESEVCFRHLHRDNYTFTVQQDPGHELLSETEITVLDMVLQQHGHKDKWVLVRETHEYPEYKTVYADENVARIPYETILRCYETGDRRRFRHGRPVISREMATRMECPFPPW